jgi:hypothetical protein
VSVQTKRIRPAGNRTDSENVARSVTIVSHPTDNRTIRVHVSAEIVDHGHCHDEVDAPDIRCRRCGHRLWAAKSLARGIGPECRRAERGEAA